MNFFLYIKTHKITGLKYLGYTSSSNPFKYPGSGKYWRSHLKIHGTDIDTEILAKCPTKQLIKQLGEYYSRLWNIVENPDWANLKIESGDGGSNGPMSDDQKQKISKKLIGRKFTEDHRLKLSISGKGRKDTRTPETLNSFKIKTSKKLTGKEFTKDHRTNMSKARIGKTHCEHTKTLMKNAWTKERKEIASERTRIQQMNKPILICPNCGKSGKSNMYRYHFNNCKKGK